MLKDIQTVSIKNKVNNNDDNDNKDDDDEEIVLDKEIFYNALVEQVQYYLDKDKDIIALTGNVAALIYSELKEGYGDKSTNWCGFYFVRRKNENKYNSNDNKNDEYHLVLGPFQGKPACNPIEFDKGVCGHTATTMKTTLVPDVHEFPV